MTFDDARKILGGGDTAATEFFKARTSDKLTGLPARGRRAMNEVGVTRQYNELIGRFEAIPFARAEAFDLDGYVVGKALDGSSTSWASRSGRSAPIPRPARPTCSRKSSRSGERLSRSAERSGVWVPLGAGPCRHPSGAACAGKPAKEESLSRSGAVTPSQATRRRGSVCPFRVKGGFHAAKQLILDLAIRYGFQVLGALVILAAVSSSRGGSAP